MGKEASWWMCLFLDCRSFVIWVGRLVGWASLEDGSSGLLVGSVVVLLQRLHRLAVESPGLEEWGERGWWWVFL